MNYRVGTHVDLKKDQYSTFTKVSNKIWPFAIAILAGYGFLELLTK